jgi:hypothetical protein
MEEDMAQISRSDAVQKLMAEIVSMTSVDLAEVYNELFPFTPTTVDQVRQAPGQWLQRITDHFQGGLHVEEIISLWHVVFPQDVNVYYDEETNAIHCNEDVEYVHQIE